MDKLKLRISYIIVLFTILFSSCVPDGSNRNKTFSNVQQQEFDNMLARFNNNNLKYSSNKIKQQEFLDSVKYATYCFVDSVRLFTNWEGKISHIDSRQSGKTTMLEFDITYKPEEYREVTFKCKYLFPTDSISSDELYQKVRGLNGYETVYFDGFIRTLANNTVKYSMSLFDNLFLPYPKFEFFIIDLSTSKRPEMNPNMNDAINLTFDAIEPLKLNFAGNISKRESDKRVKSIVPKYDEAKAKLSDSEKKYIHRLAQACTYNFLFSKD